MQAYQQKTEKFFVSEEKNFGMIDCRCKAIKSILTLKMGTQKKQPETDSFVAGIKFIVRSANHFPDLEN